MTKFTLQLSHLEIEWWPLYACLSNSRKWCLIKQKWQSHCLEPETHMVYVFLLELYQSW